MAGVVADPYGPLMGQFLDCALTQLGERGEENLPGRAILAPGRDVAWDDCCDGQLWVRLVSLVPSPSPSGRTTRTNCGVITWQATFGVGIVRCVASVNEDGTAPGPGEVTADALGMTQDVIDLETAIRCCMDNLIALRIDHWEPLGPQGGCAGGEWFVVAILGVCACP